ncbi:hypothetical protein ACX80U_05745 [Arthrobacter sp. TmT3-37]
MTDENEDKPQPKKGMLYRRYKEIAELKDKGDLSSVSPEELAEFEAFDVRMRATLNELANGISAQIRAASVIPKFNFDLPKLQWDFPTLTTPPRGQAAPAPSDPQPEPEPAETTGEGEKPGREELTTQPATTLELEKIPDPNVVIAATLQDLVGLLTQANLQHEENADYLKLMADNLTETSKARKSADTRAEQQDGTNRRLTIFGITLAAVSAISVIPVLIEFKRWFVETAQEVIAPTLIGTWGIIGG